MAGLTRSNALLNAVHFAHDLLASHVAATIALKPSSRNNGKLTWTRSLEFLNKCRTRLGRWDVAKLLVSGGVTLACLVAPFLLYQYYIFTQFCDSRDDSSRPSIAASLLQYAKENEYVVAGSSSSTTLEWCARSVSYGHVQAKYWRVGFLAYWQLRQIPNFLLAAPIVALAVRSLLVYARSLSGRADLLELAGLATIDKECDEKEEMEEEQNDEDRISPNCCFVGNKRLVPFALHLVALLVSGVFFMHVQVRFDSFSNTSNFVFSIHLFFRR